MGGKLHCQRKKKHHCLSEKVTNSYHNACKQFCRNSRDFRNGSHNVYETIWSRYPGVTMRNAIPVITTRKLKPKNSWLRIANHTNDKCSAIHAVGVRSKLFKLSVTMLQSEFMISHFQVIWRSYGLEFQNL